MRKFAQPIIIVSKCLGFDHCRWNGEIIQDDFILKLRPYVDFRPVCPEVEIGLGVPRKPIRVVSVDNKRKLLQLETGKDFTGAMLEFGDAFLSSVAEVDGFILKNRSPSCGINDVKIYPSIEKVAVSGKGAGFFSGKVVDKFYPLAVEDEGRLTNFSLREAFLARIFTHTDLRQVAKSDSMKELVDFHARNKYLLMAFSQKELKILGKIVANHEHKKFKDLIPDYNEHLNLAMAKTPRRNSVSNVLLHILGYFSQELASKEKTYFLDILDKYRKAALPLSSILSVLKSWAIKYETQYILDQTLLESFPEDLLLTIDSGKCLIDK